LIKENLAIWHLRERIALEDLLMDHGCNQTTVKSFTDEQLISMLVMHYANTFPDQSRLHYKLSASLAAVRESRNKVLAHNEEIDPSARKFPTWSDTKELVEYAKDFVFEIDQRKH